MTGLVQPGLVARRLLIIADRLQQAQGPLSHHIGGVFGLIEGHADMGLSAEIVDLMRFDGVQQAAQARAVGEIAMVQDRSRRRRVQIVVVTVKMVETGGVEGTGPPNHAMNLIAARQ